MNRSNELVISYLDLRRLVGTLGVLFPAIVAVSGFVQCQCLAFQLSISHYYDLDGVTRDLFVGILMTMATFLWTYRGYDNRDLIAARLASVCAVVVALSARSGTAVLGLALLRRGIDVRGVRLLLALPFHQVGISPTPEKLVRNKIYKACGVTILVCLLVMFVLNRLFGDTDPTGLRPILWLEAIALWAFGISWSVKGGALLRDSVTASSSR